MISPVFARSRARSARLRQLGSGFGQAIADAGPGDTYAEAMDRFVALVETRIRGECTYGLRYLLPRPRGQGAAKRLCLFLRWMVRPDDGLDLGAWRTLAPATDPACLLMPLDTHIGRIGRYLGLTERASNDLKTTLEITAALRRLAPSDPLRYDMPLCHMGISGACPQRRDPVQCAGCGLRKVCRLGPEPRGWLPVVKASAS